VCFVVGLKVLVFCGLGVSCNDAEFRIQQKLRKNCWQNHGQQNHWGWDKKVEVLES
jgi:hypothetical protein